ncbi:type-2 ice-structuring protein-like [Synchiropus picturatus]
MKPVTAFALLCGMMALTGAFVPPLEEMEAAKTKLVKRSFSCPPLWSYYYGRCYLYVTTQMSWARAEKHCQDLGGNLASIHSILDYHEIERVIALTYHGSGTAWVGASDAQQEGFWLWSDGTPFHYTNWCPGKPSAHNTYQNCAEMQFPGNKCWSDTPCNYNRPFVCTRKSY